MQPLQEEEPDWLKKKKKTLMRTEGIQIQMLTNLLVAEDVEHLLMFVMHFPALCIFIWAYCDTVNRWREDAMWNYTVEWAAMKLQRCQFQTRNIQWGEVWWEAVPFEITMSKADNIPGRFWKQFLAVKTENKLRGEVSYGQSKFSTSTAFTVP